MLVKNTSERTKPLCAKQLFCQWSGLIVAWAAVSGHTRAAAPPVLIGVRKPCAPSESRDLEATRRSRRYGLFSHLMTPPRFRLIINGESEVTTDRTRTMAHCNPHLGPCLLDGRTPGSQAKRYQSMRTRNAQRLPITESSVRTSSGDQNA